MTDTGLNEYCAINCFECVAKKAHDTIALDVLLVAIFSCCYKISQVCVQPSFRLFAFFYWVCEGPLQHAKWMLKN